MVRHSNCRSYYSFFQPTGYPVGCFHLALCPAACAYDSAARCCANGCFSDLTRQPVYMVFSARRCANGSFACARFALLRGPLVIARVRATRSRLGQRGNMLIPTFARNVTENHIYRLTGNYKTRDSRSTWRLNHMCRRRDNVQVWKLSMQSDTMKTVNSHAHLHWEKNKRMK